MAGYNVDLPAALFPEGGHTRPSGPREAPRVQLGRIEASISVGDELRRSARRTRALTAGSLPG